MSSEKPVSADMMYYLKPYITLSTFTIWVQVFKNFLGWMLNKAAI
jgi:hypothetical protein